MAEPLSVQTSYTEQLLNLFILKQQSATNTPISSSPLASEGLAFQGPSLSPKPTPSYYPPLSPDMRLPYTPNPPRPTHDEEEAIVGRILARRGAGGLIALDRTLLHAPVIADGWNAFMIAIRSRNSLPGDVRELVFCRVAALTGAWYEWNIHSPIARQEGLREDVLNVIKAREEVPMQDSLTRLSDLQMAVVRYVDAMTLHARVPHAVWQGVADYFNDKELVELTASVAGFNLVSRFVVALDVGEMNDHNTS
jgi:alkylhydroperoxidase family enzyme